MALVDKLALLKIYSILHNITVYWNLQNATYRIFSTKQIIQNAKDTFHWLKYDTLRLLVFFNMPSRPRNTYGFIPDEIKALTKLQLHNIAENVLITPLDLS